MPPGVYGQASINSLYRTIHNQSPAMNYSFYRLSLLAAIGAILSAPFVFADITASEIQGFIKFTVPANTDTLVSPALGRPVAWSGAVNTVSAGRLAVASAPGWAADQFVPTNSHPDTFYVRILSGALRGHYFTIASNDATSVLLDNAGFDLSAVKPGDSVEIAPYWTLGTLYPSSMANSSFTPSSSALFRQTELYFYDVSGVGINRAPSKTYYYCNGAWRQVGASITTSFNNAVILPDTYFLQRNKGKATALTESGRVLKSAVATVIEGGTSLQQDNFIALPFPVGVTLRQTALFESGAFKPTVSASSHEDELLVFDDTATGINRSPNAIYFYFDNGWRKTGAALTEDFSDSVILAAGHGFVVRKAAGSSAQMWTYETNL
jgi:uncharacterized protein (TIGR02597 family)